MTIRRTLAAALALGLAAAPVLPAQAPVEGERVRCQLLAFRVLAAAKGGLVDPQFAPVFREPEQRARLHQALAAVPQLEMVALDADTGALVARADLASRIAARAFVTRADVERVDKAITTEYLVSTTVMLEFFNPATGEIYHVQGLTGSTNIRKDAGVALTPGETTQAFGSTLEARCASWWGGSATGTAPGSGRGCCRSSATGGWPSPPARRRGCARGRDSRSATPPVRWWGSPAWSRCSASSPSARGR